MFSAKDPVPFHLRSRVVYKFTGAGCNACYVGETSQHISVCIREHLRRDTTSHICNTCKTLRNVESESCFSVLDTAPTGNRFQLLLKEAAHIHWENPSLNWQLKHVELTLSF